MSKFQKINLNNVVTSGIPPFILYGLMSSLDYRLPITDYRLQINVDDI